MSAVVSRRGWLLAALLALSACTGGSEPGPPAERPAPPSGQVPDAGAPDAGGGNGGAPDGGAPDAGAPDAGAPDGGAARDGGATLWERRFGDNERVHEGVAAAFAPNGDVVMASSHGGKLTDLGEAVEPERGWAAASRYTPDGRHLWTAALEVAVRCCQLFTVDATAVAVGAQGQVALAVHYAREDPDCSRDTRCTELYLWVLEPDGRERWRRKLEAKQEGQVRGLGFDAAGNLYVGGDLGGTGWDLGDGRELGFYRRPSIFVARYGPAGEHQWSRTFINEEDYTYSQGGLLAVQPDGSFTLAGTLVGRMPLGGGTVLQGPEGGRQPRRHEFLPPFSFVAHFAPDGAPRWARTVPALGMRVSALAATATGTVLVATVEHPFDFAGSRVAPAGPAQEGPPFAALALAYGPDGAERWARALGTTGAEQGTGVALDAAGSVLVASSAQDPTRTLPTGNPVHPVWVTKLREDGATVWRRAVREEPFFSTPALAASPEGRVAVTGRIWIPQVEDCEGCERSDGYLMLLAP